MHKLSAPSPGRARTNWRFPGGMLNVLNMKIVRMLVFAALGALLSAVGSAWAQVGRQPIDWSTIS
ncbi:MAG: hypothetical protein Q8K85_18620, partial [Hyphomicrobium sp.]|nr:hypothetical protein [Hyphomicrobium sp.]